MQRRRGDEAFFVGVLIGRPDDQQQKSQRGAGRHDIEIGPHGGLRIADDGRHPHVFGAAKRDRGPEHRQPEEQDRCQLVRPDQGPLQDVTRNDAGEQRDDLGDHQQCRRNLDEPSEPRFKRHRKGTAARGHHLAGRRLRRIGVSHYRPLSRLLRQFADRFLQYRPRLVAVFSLPFGIEPGRAELSSRKGATSG